ncbi:DUF4397 domain-containing protein [Spirosoma sp. BT702]|uniref:DUF4397 domain-containing protein n=1 Tax=Spirosoma profusum TaxID=2771354 RepID=A0A927ARP9_9BACT|nr:DUF4397 domain-containing protein [Spirosoma profusum]MBD2702673.1 DUF4397 domain-containing protein [Spirosoma profusum]
MKQTIAICCVALSGLLAGSCGNKFDFLQDLQMPAGAQLRFIHAAPDVPAFDVYVNERQISGAAVTTTNPTGSVLYSNTTLSVFPASEYSAIPAGTAKLKAVNASGGTVASPLITSDLAVEAGKRYSVFATGLAPSYSLLVVPDELPALSGNNLFARIVNLVPNSTDVTLTYDGKEVITGVAPGKASAFVPIAPPADYKSGLIRTLNFQAKVNGTIPVTTATFANAAPGAQPGGTFTFYVRGVMTTDPKSPTKYAISFGNYLNR